MATIRSLAQLFDWFKRGAYPKAEQFQDAFTSFWHKEENIPQDTVKGLPDSLNGKFDKTDGEALIDRADALDVRADGLESRINTNSTKISAAEDRIDDAEERLDGHDDALAEHNKRISAAESEIVSLHATDAGLRTDLTGAQADISAIREMIKGGATLDEAKAALIALGDNYKDVHAIGGTLKAFLEAADTADTTINTWKEIEHFLDGITDTESLTGLLEQLDAKITAAYTAADSQLEAAVDAKFETAFIPRGNYQKVYGSANLASGTPTSSELTEATTKSGSYMVSYGGALGHLLHFYDGGNGSARYMQLYTTYNGNLLWRKSQDADLVKEWRKIFDSGNANTVSVDWSMKNAIAAGNLTVQGAATLKGAVAIPEPTEDQHAATKKYVDDRVGEEGTYAPLDSPALTGTPTASTPALSDNSTRIATTEFVRSQVDSNQERTITITNFDTFNPYGTLTDRLTGEAFTLGIGQSCAFYSYIATGRPTTSDGSALNPSYWVGRVYRANTYYYIVEAIGYYSGTTRYPTRATRAYYATSASAVTPYTWRTESEYLYAAINGYVKFPSGLIIQWGYNSASTLTLRTITFPIAFPSACIHVGAITIRNSKGSDGYDYVSSVSSTGFQVLFDAYPGYWMAIGY